jgi:membrane protein DedA with SNARE-associated domain
MSDHQLIPETIAFVERHGYALLFWWVLAEQSAIPLPSVPLLLAAGALVRAGRLNGLLAAACCVIAALIADTVWFQLGIAGGVSCVCCAAFRSNPIPACGRPRTHS